MGENSFSLNDQTKQIIKDIAVSALHEAVMRDKKLQIDPSTLPKELQMPLGAFVTLHKAKQLRGCIGRFEPKEPLYSVIIDMAISASRYDSRFKPVSEDELDEIDVEVSVLTPRVEVDGIDDVVVGKHGIYIEYKSYHGTYLPQVATDMNWNNLEFVQHCCIHKAGIPPQHCKDAKLYVYEAIVF